MLKLQPQLRSVLDRPLPHNVSRQLGSVTWRQLEAVGCLPPEGMPMRRFAASMGITGAAATAMANRMIRQGLVERRDDPQDRRTVWLAPTPRAARALEVYRGWRRRSLRRLGQELDASQRDILVDVLSAFVGSGLGPPDPDT
jgi:DNA-binding MarR family transcriptional regulator